MRARALSRPSRTTKTLRPSGYGVFTHQLYQSLCLRTPSFSLHLLGKGLEGPTYGISIEERLLGHPNQSNSLGHCLEIDTKEWEALAGYASGIPEPRMNISSKELLQPITLTIEVKLVPRSIGRLKTAAER